MKEGAIIHRLGVLALCETKGCHRINDTLCLDLQANHRAMPCAGKPATHWR